MKQTNFNALSGKFDLVDIQTLFYNNLASFPLIGQVNQVYVAKDTGGTYIWNGSAYVATLGGVPNLQQVLDSGNISITPAIFQEGVIKTTIDESGVVIERSDNATGQLSANLMALSADGTGQVALREIGVGSGTADVYLKRESGTIALLSDIPSPLTNEQIQDSAFAILTDTATIDLTYNDAGNQVTADVIDNSINNIKASDMPANSVKVNDATSVGNPVDLVLTPNTVLGRIPTVNSGNLAPIAVQETIIATAQLVAGTALVFDTRITTASFAVVTSSSTGIITSVPIKYTATAGQMLFTTGQVGDTATFAYIIVI
jgi:hypothetical protein